MSAQLIIRCPTCSQKYRVNATTVGRNAKCKVCGGAFIIGQKTALDDDTIVSWISQDVPPSASVMGATGIFHEPGAPEAPPAQPVAARVPPSPPEPKVAAPSVKLVRTDDEGVHFEFPASLLASEELRNSFPRRCIGCGAKHGLTLHLIYWPERMAPEDRSRWRQHQDAGVGKLEGLRNAATKALLATLPTSRHPARPFRLPFPIFACNHCHASREVYGHVVTRDDVDVCELTITSLAVALDFYGGNGGQDTEEYKKLSQDRERAHDAWRDFGADIRQRLSQWFEPRTGEHFVNFFRDVECSTVEAGASGVVLTDRRVVWRKYAVHRDYPLNGPCRMEVKAKGASVGVQILEEGERPAVFTLSASDANDLTTGLRSLGCNWAISS